VDAPLSPWPSSPGPVELTAGEVHVWCAALARPAEEVAELASLLSPDEQERAARYRVTTAREQFGVSRALLRVLLGRYLDRDPSRLEFRPGPQGKPALAGPAPLSFNVSHSYGVALFAVRAGGEVGVDLEQVRPFENDLGLAERFFCAAEAAALRALGDERRAAFFHVWTRKEAYLKASGLGLAGGLERVEVSVPPDDPPRVLRIDGVADAARRWSLRALSPLPGYVGALAVEGHDYRLRCWRLDDILSGPARR
jgi:4'-phosphopantetheinyl transferase